jgi:regulatory protein
MPGAYDEAVRLLARRALSRLEIERKLAERGHDPGDVAQAVERLVAARAIDDDALARALLGSRAKRRGSGPDRALAELESRGIPAAAAERAWREAVDDGAIDPDAQLARAVAKKLGPPPGRADRGRLSRVYNALLSEGFERDAIEAALVPYGLERNDP